MWMNAVLLDVFRSSGPRQCSGSTVYCSHIHLCGQHPPHCIGQVTGGYMHVQAMHSPMGLLVAPCPWSDWLAAACNGCFPPDTHHHATNMGTAALRHPHRIPQLHRGATLVLLAWQQ